MSTTTSTSQTQSLADAVGRQFEESLQPEIRALFHEAYEEAMAEGKAMLKQRMLAVLLGETTQHVDGAQGMPAPAPVSELAAAPQPATPKSATPKSADQSPVQPQSAAAQPTARIHTLGAGSESAPASEPAGSEHPEPAWQHEAILKPSEAPPPPATPETPAVAPQASPSAATLPPPVRDDDLDSSLRGQIEYIRRQISRNEELLSQLRPFLKAVGS